MQSSAVPSKIQLPFANAGAKNTIPVASQIATNPSLASFTDGFPPATRTPLAAGGVPPSGADMNGILNAVTAIQQWQSAGGLFKFDATFSAAIGGYPKGAMLISSTGTRGWLNTMEGNTTDPDSAGSVGWISALVGLSYLPTTTTVSAATTLTQATLGGIINLTGSSYTVTLPANSACPAGSTYTFICSASGTINLVPSGTDQFAYGFVSSIQIKAGDTLVITCSGLGYWWVTGGSSQLKAAPGFAALTTANGYQKFPNGLIQQWGSAVTNASGTSSVSFPIAFPNAFLQSTATCVATSAQPYIATVGSMTTSGMTISTSNGSGSAISVAASWIAIGY